MARSRSSKRWLAEHFNDPYVRKAQQLGLRSRAAFKLEEIDRRDRLLKPGATVLDLGAAPGGWSQYAARRVGCTGRVIATDILAMEALAGVEFVEGDFTQPQIVDELTALLDGQRVDVVLSDMAPNLSGQRVVDQYRAMHLAELALDAAFRFLKPGGCLLIKAFQGEEFDRFLADVKRHFSRVSIRKPDASRDRSREVYVLARDFKNE